MAPAAQAASKRPMSQASSGISSRYPEDSVRSTWAGSTPELRSALRMLETNTCRLAAYESGGSSFQTMSASADEATARRRLTVSAASRARGLGPPTATGSPPTNNRTGPSTRTSRLMSSGPRTLWVRR
ncbi:Uncharacterised protein [Mycobacteroides abscessus subsp. abscessus]|nr:Uncharacterised protein [Mycobacteroides abscessus subsp. abscessus]